MLWSTVTLAVVLGMEKEDGWDVRLYVDSFFKAKYLQLFCDTSNEIRKRADREEKMRRRDKKKKMNIQGLYDFRLQVLFRTEREG